MFLVVKQETLKQSYVTAFERTEINHLIYFIYGWEKEVPRYENDISAKEKIQI